MTLDLTSAGIPAAQPEQERPADPRPAWERIAYTWLQQEVDGDRPVTAAQLAAQASVTPTFAADLLGVLRAQRQRDPALTQLRARLVRDQLTDLYVTRELRGGQRLDPATVASELGTTTTVARQWLHALRGVREHDPRLASLRATPEDHGQVHADELTKLAERFRAGGPAPEREPTRPVAADALTDRIELAFRRQQATGEPLDPARLARELSTSRHYVTSTLVALQAGAPSMRQRIEAAYQQREVESGRWVNLTDLAAELGTSKAYVQRVISPLRAAHRHQRTTTLPAAADPTAEGRGWLDLAACKDTDPELFFPERGEKAKGLAAKQVCAACQVRQQCRELAVRTARSREEDHGIFGATTPHQRSRLRGNPTPGPSSWYQDRAAAEEAHRLAVQLGPVAAAQRLGTATSTLARAFAKWGLDYPGRPRASVFARDPERAREAFALAEQLGSIKGAARELASSRPALVAGWRRFGLGMPDTSHPTVTGPGGRPARRGEPAGRLDPVFVKLNQDVLPVRTSSEAERFWRVRRAEQYATLGAAAVTELYSESRSARTSARVWAITRRAQRAQTLARERATRGKVRHGLLHLSGDMVLFPADGQHRLAAEVDALKVDPDIGKEEIPVVFIPYQTTDQVRQLFSDLNLNAKPISKTIGYAYEQRDPLALLAKTVAVDVDLFSGRVNKRSNSLPRSSTNVITLNTLVKGTDEIVKALAAQDGIDKDQYLKDVSRSTTAAAEVWAEIVNAFDQHWPEVEAGTTTPGELRDAYLFPHGLGWLALAKAASQLIEKYGPEDWVTPFHNAVNALDWERTAAVWDGNAVIHDRAKGTNRVNNTGPAVNQLAAVIVANAQ